MNNLSKNYLDDDGKEKTIVATSEDDYQVNLEGGFTLANHKEKKESRLVKKFKGSILATDVGVRSKGFSSVAILATVIVLSIVIALYFLWRF